MNIMYDYLANQSKGEENKIVWVKLNLVTKVPNGNSEDE